MGKTQASVARALKIKQGSVARLEAHSDMLVSTLRSYIQALGGDVCLTVEMKGHPPVRLDGLGDLEPEPRPGKIAIASRRTTKKASEPA